MKTYHDGAREERRAWMRHLRCLKVVVVSVKTLLAWGQERRKRYEQKPLGLGRAKGKAKK